MIRQIIEKVGVKNTTKKVDNALKFMKTNIDSRMPIKIDWGKSDNSLNKKGVLVGKLKGVFIMQGHFDIKVKITEEPTTEKDDKIYLEFKISMTEKSSMGNGFDLINRTYRFTLGDSRRTKTAISNATKVLSEAIKENQRRGFVFQFEDKDEIVKAVKSGKKVYYGDVTNVIWDSTQEDLMLYDTKSHSLTNFSVYHLGNNVARCYTKDGK